MGASRKSGPPFRAGAAMLTLQQVIELYRAHWAKVLVFVAVVGAALWVIFT